MSRLPIRMRLTAVFVAVMSVVLIVIGSFLYYRTKDNLDDSIAQSLRARQSALRTYTRSTAASPGAAIPPGERFAQLLSADGDVIASHPDGAKALLTPAQAQAALRITRFSELHERDRFLAGRSWLRGTRVVAVVGASLAERERALESLGGALLVGGPLALLLASVIAYATAAAALRPVEAMRRQAATISRADATALLPVPDVDDELRRLSHTLNDMLARIARSAAHERAFVANASHELRTPLAALAAELELAERHPGPPAQTTAALHLAREDVQRLIGLTEDLLALARIDEARGERRESIDVDELLSAVADGSRHRGAEAGRAVTTRPSGLSITGDASAVRRAMANLLDNALMHGSGGVSLGADLALDGRAAELWVDDEGDLDPALGHRVFERFTRGPGAAGKPGAGLGLALVQVVARDHGGSASLQRRPEGGVRAALRLPAVGSRRRATAVR